ncbi:MULTISPECIES: Flp pilus assembly complex ATPase component TadA [Paenibacillus]|uniref:Flp pilus assembly complex ATPase component TadA n=1 Tax=Paenibacillus vandeheii TaxID=3035917 RepID=A0ABT8JFT2_9BACL|nr:MULTISPECIES: Flp pilus assembly complex ATPase component TadA [Paenibacillus]KGP81369.1 hypothetical protein P363_0128165 [Paenibacillus sp. MAEPY1]KGP82005.1 hypothetical protein P364_0114420 [Paenibacillus sp. MAEPY2]MDN4603927.1 Flp pilus assembly complex ATPase component TadA [Paenibacillus vandeheii]
MQTTTKPTNAMEQISSLIAQKKNILLITEDGKGATSLLYSLAASNAKVGFRSLVIEDHRPAVYVPNSDSILFTASNSKQKSSLFDQALLLRADYLYVSELRGTTEISKYFDLIGKGMKGCMTTLVAKNPEHAIRKLSRLFNLSYVDDLSQEDMLFNQRWLASNLHYIVSVRHVQSFTQACTIDDITSVTSDQTGKIRFQSII